MGIAGRIAKAFLRSKLTPLITIASLAVGGLALLATPREEEPQISVPMIDVMAMLPGASPTEVENLLTRPIEKLMWEVPGVEYVYASASEGMTLVTVRFTVGEDQDRAVSRVHAKLASAADAAPPGAMPPLVKPHSIDDVPILALTLHGAGYGSDALRTIATRLGDDLATLPDVARIDVIGGAARQLTVTLDPVRLAGSGVTPGEVMQALGAANVRLTAGDFASANAVFQVSVGAPIRDATDAGLVVVADRGGPVYLRNVATITDGPAEPTSYVSHATRGETAAPAVTLALAKRPGVNATDIAHAALHRLEQARGRIVPAGVTVDVTRDYGETASEKANELILHLMIATLSVTVLIGLFLGWREALVVLVAVPVTLALTLFVYYALGYSLNRITLFALIFSIGILVDDAIVVVENIYRHLQMGDKPPETAAVEGVDEVGNPTILATFTVIAAILPMAFVSGLMGPYMRPIPIGASAAMLASLAVAFIITPYLAFRLLRGHVRAVEHPVEATHTGPEPTGFARFYARVMTPLMDSAGRRTGFYGGVVLLLLLSIGLLAVKLVEVKMLPFDNKSEFQVVLDFPEGTTLETSNAAADAIARWLRTVPEVTSTETYAGTAAPFNFNGLVRHYFLRRGANVADVQVNLLPKGERHRQSHDIAVAVRPAVDSIARHFGASAKIAEIPPGPPVLSTLVAEIYAADDSTRLEAARRVKAVMEATPGVVDVDWTVEAPQARRDLPGRSRPRRGGGGERRAGGAGPHHGALRHAGRAARRQCGARGRGDRAAARPRRSQRGRGAAGGAGGHAARPDAAGTVRHGRLDHPVAAPDAEEPPAGDLRDRRRGRAGRVAGVRHPGDEPRARHRADRRRHDRPLQRGRARTARRNGDQVGRRVAGDDRGLPRPGDRLRRGADPDLCAGGGVVPVVQGAAGHHGADPAHADRHPAGPRDHRRILHRDVDDRDDRAGRDHRPQLDPAGGLHPARRGARPAAARGGARGGCGAVPPDRAHRRGGGDRRDGDGARPDLPGPCRGADERRRGGHDAHHGGGAAALLGAAAPRGGAR